MLSTLASAKDYHWIGAPSTTLGLEGFVDYISRDSNKGDWRTSTTVIMNVDLSLEGSPMEIETRTLASGFTLRAGNFQNFVFKTESGDTLTRVEKVEDIKSVNQCYLFNDDAGNIKVQYFQAKSVPEPSSAALGLFSFSLLYLRRRRA